MQSLALWERNLLTRAVRDWRGGAQAKRAQRKGLRSLWSTRFVMRLLNHSVPKQVVQKYRSYGEELLTPLEVIPLHRKIDSGLEATVQAYENEVARRLFSHWKAWYERVRGLK